VTVNIALIGNPPIYRFVEAFREGFTQRRGGVSEDSAKEKE
jgi:hypothetical protein